MAEPSTDPIASVSPPISPSLSTIEAVELPKEERINRAVEAFKKMKDTTSLNKIARQHGIWPSTLHNRITTNGISTTKFNQSRQRLSPEEETVIEKYICRLQAWGWPGRVEHIKCIAQELCTAKGDTKQLGINWIQKYLRRHPDIRTKYIPPLDKERALAEDYTILNSWFQLFHLYQQKYSVLDRDIYNMDEKGFLQGVIAKFKVMISRHEKKEHMTQPGNREWVSTIEYVSAVGRLIRPYIIFKAAIHKRAWFDAFPGANIAISENGWTDNEIGLLWLQHFAKETAVEQEGQYRILIFDGHASHISTAAVKFAVSNNIILLCLPPHTTHLLQPLDVGLFAPLASAYKQNVHSITRLGASYSIDKIDFLEQYQRARTVAFTKLNIQKAWEKTGLLPYNPSVVLQAYTIPEAPQKPAVEQYTMTIRPSTPSEGVLDYTGPNGSSSKILTPGTTIHVQALLKRAHAGEEDLEIVCQKVGKAAILAMAEATIQEQTNKGLLELNNRKEQKAKRRKGNVTNGHARVLNQESLDDDAWTKEWTFQSSISPQIFEESQAAMKRRRKALASQLAPIESPHDAWTEEWTFQSSISPQIFEESQAAMKRRRKALASQLAPIGSPQKRLQKPQKAQTCGKRSNRAPQRPTRLLVRLRVRVTTQELEQGRWAIKVGAGSLEDKDLAEDIDQLQAMGRGQRVRKPRRAS